ncbi:MAG TPA: sugar ABC transporter substrate-binding protein [Limnochordia bacterium]|nr:sugar ABC transporter substrate-binding protein [Limnochordia bacterium]
MKKAKTRVWSVAALAVAATALPVGVAAAADAKVELSVAGWWNIRGFDALVQRFESEHPGVTVTKVGSNNGPYNDPLIAMAAGGTSPDVVWTNYGNVPATAPAGVLAPLDERLKLAGFDIARDSFAPAWKQMSYAGVIYAAPLFMASSGVSYNKTMFGQAGLSDPAAGWTWNDMIADSDKMLKQDASGKTTQWGFTTDGWSLTSGKGVAPFLWANGGDIIDSAGHFALDRPESLQAMRWFVDVTLNHPSVYSPAENKTLDFWKAFPAGSIGMWSTASSNNSLLIEQVSAKRAFDWDVAPLPVDPNTDQVATYVQTDGIGIGKYAKHPELAWAFVQLTMSPWFQQSVITGQFGLIPIRRDSISSYVGGTFPPPHKQVFVDALAGARDFNHLADLTADGKLYDLVHDEWNDYVMTNQEDVGTFVAKMKQATATLVTAGK